jgi:hypothetical protein
MRATATTIHTNVNSVLAHIYYHGRTTCGEVSRSTTREEYHCEAFKQAYLTIMSNSTQVHYLTARNRRHHRIRLTELGSYIQATPMMKMQINRPTPQQETSYSWEICFLRVAVGELLQLLDILMRNWNQRCYRDVRVARGQNVSTASVLTLLG